MLQYLFINNSLNFMFDKTSIAQKEAQGVFTKTYSPLVASFKVGAYLFLIFLFDFFESFSLSIVAPFMLFGLHKRASNNRCSACWPPRPPRIHSDPPMLFSIIPCASFLLNFKAGINFPPLRKCPSTSAVFTSVTAMYHANFRSGQNLVAHFLSIEIGACILPICLLRSEEQTDG